MVEGWPSRTGWYYIGGNLRSCSAACSPCRKIEHQVLNAKLHQREAEVVALAGRKGCVTIATNMAGRGTDIKLTPEVRDAGGLAIIGTERHESRRVDRQLRGRAGRQGDPVLRYSSFRSRTS